MRLGVDGRLTVMLPAMGIDAPSPIQQAAIPQILSGESLVIQSCTGSGKTLAFLLPVLTKAVIALESRVQAGSAAARRGAPDDAAPVVVVVAPARELAMQAVRVAQRLLPQEAWPFVQQAIGGANLRRQRDALRTGRALVVVGTPGRLAELSRMGVLRTHAAAALVLDEVDQLLCEQFRADLLRIVQHTGCRLPGGPQIIGASATADVSMARELQAVLRRDASIPVLSAAGPLDAAVAAGAPAADEAAPAELQPLGTGAAAARAAPMWGWRPGAAAAAMPSTRGSAGGIGATLPSASMPAAVTHVAVTEAKRHHVDAVRRLVHALGAQRAIVFMNHQARVRDAMHKLAARGLTSCCLHGEMGKQQRQTILEAFRAGKFRVMVVSDLLSRGLDVPECDAVINLELPSSAAHYVHRAGRTGRMGRPGVVATVVEEGRQFVVDKLARELGCEIQACRVTAGRAEVAGVGGCGAVRILSDPER